MAASKMKTHEIRELTTEELQSRSRDLKQQMLHLRIQKATGQMENKSAIGHLKKEVARILTVVQEEAGRKKGGGKEDCQEGGVTRAASNQDHE
jgi:large subunit ribosomal protein L29